MGYQQMSGRKARAFSLDPKFLAEFEGRQPAWGPVGYFVYKRSYALDLPDGSQEEFWQTCQRVVEGVYYTQKLHCRQLGLPWSEPKAQRSAQEMYRRMWDFKFTPPGRGLAKMGTDAVALKGGACLNNCAMSSTALINEDFARPFTFLMDMSMLGVGVGGDTRGAGKVRLQKPSVTQTPFVVEDTREGWVALAKCVLNSFVGKGAFPGVIDFTQLRPAGVPLKTFGGKASGPGPLQDLVRGLTRLLLPEGATVQFEAEGHPIREGEPGILRTFFGGQGKHQPISVAQIVDVFNMVGKCVVAGGLRRTAEIMFGGATDPEFLNLKNPDTLNALYAERTTIEQALQVKPDDPSLLADLAAVQAKISEHPLVSHRWASNNSVLAEVGMDYTDIAQRIAQNGEPGIIWLKNAQAYSRMVDAPDWKDEKIVGANPCITGDTLIYTGAGPQRADKLLNKPFRALVDGAFYECQTGVFQTGTKPVYLVQTKEGHGIRVTADHKILTAPKVTPKKRYEMWVEAQDLIPGDRVVLNNCRTGADSFGVQQWLGWEGMGTWDQGWLLGNLLGDGHFHAAQETAKLQFWGTNKQEMLALALQRIELLGGDPRYHQMRNGTEVEDRDMVSTGSRRLWELAPEFGISYDKDILNDTLVTASSEFQAGFLRGLFDADGSVQGTQEKGASIRLGLVNRQHLVVTQKMLMNFGINSTIYWDRQEARSVLLPDGKGGEAPYNCHSAHELVISNDNISVFAQRIGFDDPDKREKLTRLLDSYKRNLNRDRFVASVASVTYVGVEPVYDCTVEEVHRFGANGILVHNCMEQSLEDHELCTLVETYPAHHDSYEDFQRTLKFAYLYAKTVTLTLTHDPRTNAVMARNRRIGCSMSGIRQAITKLGRREFLRWCDSGYQYIQKLDKVYSDWLGIPRSIKTTSVKPSGTVSLLCGATPGVHLPHSEFYIRNVRVNSHSPYVKAAQEAGYMVEPDRHAPNTMVISFPVKEENYSKGKKDATMWEQMALASDLQRYWADNQVSVTVTFKPEEARDIKSCLEVFEDRLKGISLLPLLDHGYEQAPYIEIDEATYERMTANLKPMDLTRGKRTKREVIEAFCDGDTCTLAYN